MTDKQEYCCDKFKNLIKGKMISVDRKGRVISWYNEDPYTIKELDRQHYPETVVDNFNFCPYCSTALKPTNI